MIDKFTHFAEQPVQSTYSPINFGALGQLGEIAEKRKSAVADNLENEFDSVLKTPAVPGSTDEQYVRNKGSEMQDLVKRFNAEPDGYNPAVSREYVQKARKLMMDPQLKLASDNYGAWKDYKKNKSEQLNAGKSHPDNWFDLDREHAAITSGQTPLGYRFGQTNLSSSGVDRPAGVDIGKGIDDYMKLHESSSDELHKFATEYYKSDHEGISRLRNDNRAHQIVNQFASTPEGEQLTRRYERIASGNGNAAESGSLIDINGRPISNAHDYILDQLMTKGRQQVYSKTKEAEGVVNARNAAVSKPHGDLHPVLITKEQGQALPFNDSKSLFSYYDQLQDKINKNKTDLAAAMQPGAASSEDIQKLQKEQADLGGQLINLNSTWKTASKLPGNVDDNIKKLAENSYKPARQTIPAGDANKEIKDTENIPHKTSSSIIEGGGLLNYAKDLQLQSTDNDESVEGSSNKPWFGADSKEISPDNNLKVLQDGKLSVKDLEFSKDGSPILNVSVTKRGTDSKGNATDIVKSYAVKNVPNELLLGIANDHNMLRDNYKDKASRVDNIQDANTYLGNANDHQQASKNIQNAVVNKYISSVTSSTASNQPLVFNLAAVGVPGVSFTAKKDGNNYTIQGVGTVDGQGLQDLINYNVEHRKSK